MRHRTWLVGALAGLALLRPAVAQDRPLFQPPRPSQPPAPLGMPTVPLTSLAPGVRERVASVLEKPALSSRGPTETFNADAMALITATDGWCRPRSIWLR